MKAGVFTDDARKHDLVLLAADRIRVRRQYQGSQDCRRRKALLQEKHRRDLASALASGQASIKAG
jgi:hypothetical protein